MDLPFANWVMEIKYPISIHTPHIPLMITNTARSEMDKLLSWVPTEGVKKGEMTVVMAKERTGKSGMTTVRVMMEPFPKLYWAEDA